MLRKFFTVKTLSVFCVICLLFPLFGCAFDAAAAGPPEDIRSPHGAPGTKSEISTDLESFLVDVVCDAPTNENGDYVIDFNVPYDLTLSFAESEERQFDHDAYLVYGLPASLSLPDTSDATFDIDIVDEYGPARISGNTFRISGGKLLVRLSRDDPNLERMRALANLSFRLTLSVSFDGTEETITFSPEIEKNFIYESHSDLAIEKTVAYDKNSDTAYYVLQVRSTGENENVVIRDRITGTALSFNRDVSASSSVSGSLDVTPDYASVPNGFSLEIPHLKNGEVVTVRYSASVDNDKITGNGTAAQTGNTARVTSDQLPEGKETSADFSGKVNFHKVSKAADGAPVPLGGGKYEVTWRVKVNLDHKMSVGGKKIYDWIDSASQPFMQFGGDGLTVEVTREDGRTETRVIPWEELETDRNEYGLYGWGYTPPVTDGKAAYVILCKSIVDTSAAFGDLNLTNSVYLSGTTARANVTISGVGGPTIVPKKTVIRNTPEKTEWEIRVKVPGQELPDFRIVDDMPRQDYGGVSYIDYLIEDSMTVEGLIGEESYKLYVGSDKKSWTMTFYRDRSRTQTGLLATPDGSEREIVLRFKSAVNQEWLELAQSVGYDRYYQHTNRMTARVGSFTVPANASVIPIRPHIEKKATESSFVRIDGSDYPVYRYELTVMGPCEDGIRFEDLFDTAYLRYYEADGVRIYGGMSYNPTDPDGDVSAADTPYGLSITVDRFPKDRNGQFYALYKIFYSLIVKDRDALDELNQTAAETGGVVLSNVAVWGTQSTDPVEVVHTYFPYVDKELVTPASAENGYVAEFKLLINPYADDLDPDSDTLNIQDELSPNLRFIQDSLVITPQSDSVKVSFDRETNSLYLTGIPDNTRFEIRYRARVLGKGDVTYSNTVKFGKYDKTVEQTVQVSSAGSGSGSNPSITLVKRDAADLTVTLPGATFRLLYLRDGVMTPVRDGNGEDVLFTTGTDGSVLIVGNQSTLGWTLWTGRTYCLVETEAPIGYQISGEPVYFVLSEDPASQTEYDVSGDHLDVSNARITREISVEKTWIGPAAESVTLRLLADGTVVEEITLTETENWKHTFTGLPRYDAADGHEIVYRIEEPRTAGYSSAVTGDPATGYTVTNTNTETLDLPVEKIWIGPAAESVTLRLLADGTVVEEITLTETENWKHTFTGLPRYDTTDGHEIAYRIEEPRTAGYSSAVTGDPATGYTVTNTNTETLDLPVEKVWIGPAAESVTLRLLADGTVVEEITLTETENWKHTFTGLPRYDTTDGHEIAYRIEEPRTAGYSSAVTGDPATGYTVTNTNTETLDLPVEKIWIGPAAESVTLRLLADGTVVEEITLTETENWKHTFTGLPRYDTTDGYEIVYTLTEDPVEDYIVSIEGDTESGFVVTNTRLEPPETPPDPPATGESGDPVRSLLGMLLSFALMAGIGLSGEKKKER